MNLRKAWFTLVQIAYDLFLKANPRKLAAHAIIQDGQGRVLVLRSRYAGAWSFPGGGLNRRENLDTAVLRECREELGAGVAIEALTGMYYHNDISAYVAIFRCRIVQGEITLSHEHTELCWADPSELNDRLRQMAEDALRCDGQPMLRTFA